jgi:hypothetical protein
MIAHSFTPKLFKLNGERLDYSMSQPALFTQALFLTDRQESLSLRLSSLRSLRLSDSLTQRPQSEITPRAQRQESCQCSHLMPHLARTDVRFL